MLGDLNDFEFSPTARDLEGGGADNLIDTLPKEERYTYVFDGNSQALDHILVSDNSASEGPNTTSSMSTPSSPTRRATTIPRSPASCSATTTGTQAIVDRAGRAVW